MIDYDSINKYSEALYFLFELCRNETVTKQVVNETTVFVFVKKRKTKYVCFINH